MKDEACGTLAQLQQRESKLLGNLTMDGHLFKEWRGICLSPKRGLFLGQEEFLLFILRLVEGLIENFHLEAQTTRISKLLASQG